MLYLQDPDVTIHQGDALKVLAGLPDGSVHCCVTSPPYWGLRDYGTGEWEGGDPECDHLGQPKRTQAGFNERYFGRPSGEDKQGELREPFKNVCGKCGARRVDQQLGLEPTPEEYVDRLVGIFREVRRVLRDDGTLWLNLGDSYSGGGGYAPDAPVNVARRERGSGVDGNFRFSPRVHERQLVKPKVQTGLKPKDLVGIPWRVAFALQADGWYLRSDIVWSKPNPMPESVTDRPTKAHEYVFLLSKSPRYFFDQEAVREPAQNRGEADESRIARSERDLPRNGAIGRFNRGGGSETGFGSLAGRNVRSVWEIATKPYAEAHFAVFPPELARRCILAGTSERGVCPECGAPWCEHDHAPVPATVLDPFLGSGTTALVAREQGRRALGVELNPEYCELASRRLSQLSLLAEVGA